MKRSDSGFSAFSLVEVTLALGIVSFALVAILGLMPVGLKLVKNADEQGGAASIITSLAESIRSARTTDNKRFTWTFGGKDYDYTVGQAGTVLTSIENLNLEGVGVLTADKRFTTRVEITPPASLAAPGTGTVSVAWSAQANPVWNSSNKTWTKADGYLTTGIQFVPKL